MGLYFHTINLAMQVVFDVSFLGFVDAPVMCIFCLLTYCVYLGNNTLKTILVLIQLVQELSFYNEELVILTSTDFTHFM